MSANIYRVEDLLIGTFYRSSTIKGVIISAEKDERCVWYPDATSYLVEIEGGQWRTVAVRTA